MAVVNGQIANQNTFNQAFMSRTASATATVAVVSLQNPLVASGAFVQNVQAAINKAFEGVGATGETDTNINNYASNFYIVDGDNRKVAIEKLDTQLKTTQNELDAAETTITNHEGRIQDLELNDMTIGGNKTFSGNMVVVGNFEVQGTTTYLNTTNTDVEDANITLNKGGTNGSAEGSGFTVERPAGDAGLQFDSSLLSKFKIGLIGSLYEVMVTGLNQVVTGLKDFTGGLKVDNVVESTLNAGVTIDGTLIKDGLVDGRDVSADGGVLDAHVANTSNPHATTKTQVGLGNVTDDAQLKRAAGDFNTFANKVTPSAADIVLIEDSTDSYNKKKVLMSAIGGGGGGSGTGIRNMFSSAIQTGDSVTGFNAFKDGVGANPLPLDGTGGTPSGGMSLAVSPVGLSGTNALRWSKISASNQNGEGYSIDLAVDVADRGNVVAFTMDYTVLSGTYANGDGIIYAYDVTNGALIHQFTPYVIPNHGLTSAPFFGEVQIPYTCATLRFMFYCASTASTTWELGFDNLVLGRQAKQYGSGSTDPVGFTPVYTGLGTVTTTTATWSRFGKFMRVLIRGTTGTHTAVEANIQLPNGAVLDTAAMSSGNTVGMWKSSITGNDCYVIMGSTNNTLALSGVGVAYSRLNGTGLNNTQTFSFFAEIPILGWSSSQLLSQDANTRVVGFRITKSGTNPNHTVTTTWEQVLGFSVSDDDVGGVSSNSYVVKVPGWYDLSASISFTGAASGYAMGAIYINGSPRIEGSACPNNTSTGARISVAGKTKLLVGDVVTLWAWQNSGAALPYFTGSGTQLSALLQSGPAQIAASETVLASYSTNAGQNLVHNTSTVVNYEDKIRDTHGAVTTGAGWKFYAPISGTYTVKVKNIVFNAAWPSGTTLSVLLRKNGAGYRYLSNRQIEGAVTVYRDTGANSCSIQLLAGEYIDVVIFHNRGADSSLHADGADNYIDIERTGNY